MSYVAAPGRYDSMLYNRCGRSGLLLPAISLGLWQNFGHSRPVETSRAIIRRCRAPYTRTEPLFNPAARSDPAGANATEIA